MKPDRTNSPYRRQTALIGRRSFLRLAGAAATVAASGVSSLSSAIGQESVPNQGPSPLQSAFTFEALVTLLPAVEIGPSSHGIRRYIPITGGTFMGPRIRGSVLPGGADWQLERPDGVTEVDALYSIKTDDGAVIIVHNRGLLSEGGSYFRTVPQFEAPRGPYDWLNKSIFIGSVAGAPRPGAVVVRVFRVL